MKELLESLRMLLSLFFLVVSAWHDFKTREVPNKVWACFGPAGLALTSLQFYLDHLSGGDTDPVFWLLSFIVTTGISLGLFYVGFFGGADAKALICLAVALPGYPSLTLHHFTVLFQFFPLAVLSNAVLGSSLLVLVITSRNLLKLIQTRGRLFEGLESEPIWSKVLAFTTGFKIDLSKLGNSPQYIPLECFSRGKDGEIIRHLRISPRLEEESAQDNHHLDEISEKLDGEVWVTLGLPFLVFVTAGFVAALVIGDFITWLIAQLVITGGT